MKDKPDITGGGNAQPVAKAALVSLLERCENMQEQIDGLKSDLKDIKTEAKAQGFDMPSFNTLLKLRAMDADKAREQEDMRQFYIDVLGIFG